MSEEISRKRPYRTLGWHLKTAREQLKQSTAEVSGAVEIDVEALEKIEYGEHRPSEDILLLLISHLGFADEEATSLWELAGYIGKSEPDQAADDTKHVAMVMPMDIRVVYTDMVHVMVNDYGVVMNFMQGAGPNNQPLAVARVGMSKEHAQSVLDILQQTLEQAKQSKTQKFLPSHYPRRRSKGADKS